jgi:UDP-N-acetylmuramoyl-tripeptide--D-alanyl-D-alanine ligase
MASNLHARIITYGFAKDADVRAETPRVFLEKDVVVGMETNVSVYGKDPKLVVRGALGRQQLYGPLSAIALASALSVNASDALHGLDSYVPPPGRGIILSGIKGSLLIDDSYNASPSAVEYALDSLASIPGITRRIAVLGDMLELGRYSVVEHQRIGTKAAVRADLIVAVGVRSRATAEAAKLAGMSEAKILTFDNALTAAEELITIVGKGDAVLIKGSQGVRLERIVKALLANPDDSKYLVRQEPEWQKIP